MNDMAAVIIPKSDQKNADDLISGPITIKITEVTIRGGQEQPISVHFEGDEGKPYKPCKSMCRVMVTAWGADSKKYIGRSLTLYRDATVKWAGLEVGGIRISHMSDIDANMTMALTMTKSNRKPFTVRRLTVEAAPKDDTEPVYITPDEATVLEKRLDDNAIALTKVKKAFGVERLSMLTPEQLASAHAMIDTTIKNRREVK